jgi:hypothetical protein
MCRVPLELRFFGDAVYCAQVLRDSLLVGESKPTLRRRSEKTPYIVASVFATMTGRLGEGFSISDG